MLVQRASGDSFRLASLRKHYTVARCGPVTACRLVNGLYRDGDITRKTHTFRTLDKRTLVHRRQFIDPHRI
jgi:hypothetical protein